MVLWLLPDKKVPKTDMLSFKLLAVEKFSSINRLRQTSKIYREIRLLSIDWIFISSKLWNIDEYAKKDKVITFGTGKKNSC